MTVPIISGHSQRGSRRGIVSLRTGAISAVALLLAAAAAVVVLSWRASKAAVHPSSATYDWRMSDFPRLRPVEVAFPGSDGIRLAGRFFGGNNGATVVLVHGYGGNQDEMLPVADALVGSDFNVFTYDTRGCGRSGGDVTFGALETDDVISVIDYLEARPDVDRARIGALGFSMGAASTVMAAARDPRIKAVVDDSGWASAYGWLRPEARDVLLRPHAPFSPLSLKFVEFRTGIHLNALRPVDVIARINPRPILLIHGGSDTAVPPTEGDRNFAAAGPPKQLWLIPDAKHGDTIQLVVADYADRVVGFFRQHLSVE